MMIPSGYKQTEIGIIPEDWRFCCWKDVGDGFISGATPSRSIEKYYKGNIKWVSSGELNYNIIYETIEHISKEAKAKTNLKLHNIGTFLMAITGLEAAGTRGSCAILGVPATTNQSCLAIYGTKKLDIKYLYYYYVNYGNSLAFKYCQGTKQQSYTAKIVKSLPIACPREYSEQEKIAEVLSDIDALIVNLEKEIEKKKNIKQGTMQQLLTGKIRLNGFTENWEKRRLGSIAKLFAGGTPSTTIDSYWGGDINWICSGEIQDCVIKKSAIKDKITQEGLRHSAAKIIKPGSVLLAMTGATCGKSAFLPFATAANQSVMAIEPIEYNAKYIYYVLQNSKNYILSFQAGGAQSGINKTTCSNLEFIFPTEIQEQKAIAEVLSNMDNEIKQLEEKLLKYQEIKRGAMQQLLTGKIRLV